MTIGDRSFGNSCSVLINMFRSTMLYVPTTLTTAPSIYSRFISSIGVSFAKRIPTAVPVESTSVAQMYLTFDRFDSRSDTDCIVAMTDTEKLSLDDDARDSIAEIVVANRERSINRRLGGRSVIIP